jgi:hypothetical protein
MFQPEVINIKCQASVNIQFTIIGELIKIITIFEDFSVKI